MEQYNPSQAITFLISRENTKETWKGENNWIFASITCFRVARRLLKQEMC